jgi:hypothetical protein
MITIKLQEKREEIDTRKFEKINRKHEKMRILIVVLPTVGRMCSTGNTNV